MKDKKILEEFKKTYPEKFLPPERSYSATSMQEIGSS